MNNIIEITLIIDQETKENEVQITEEQVWLIMSAAKTLVESRNTILEILGNKAQDFINSIIEIDER